jgi:hypothetical protein
MKLAKTLLTVALVILTTCANAVDGMVSLKSPHAARETMDRFESLVKARGLTVFIRIDHAAGAAKIGKLLRPTEVLIFGNPQGGTPLMECAQTSGIDLPLKALVGGCLGPGLAGLQRSGLSGAAPCGGRLSGCGESAQDAVRSGRGRRCEMIAQPVLPIYSPTMSAPAGGVNLKSEAGSVGLRSSFEKRISVV